MSVAMTGGTIGARAGVSGGGAGGEWTALRPAVERALDCLGRELGRDGIELELEVAGDVRVRASAVSVEHVLLNLILNARKAVLRKQRAKSERAREEWGGDEGARGERGVQSAHVRSDRARARDGVDGGAGRIRVGARVESGGAESEESWVEVVVEDNGVGMSAGEVGRLFAGFFTKGGEEGSGKAAERQSGEVKRRSGGAPAQRGTGLGMVVCRRLVEQAGGTISAESRVGEGTRVVVRWRGGAGGSREE
ncbi:MAG: HAMP domain-containing histidine kinase [Phycisphaeraceae bacterium]|nr:HAMP domain-containing histidine kinase [Phycisphaeraceae bacterium]